MELKDFIEQALDALQKRYHRAIGGLTAEDLLWQAGPNANSIGFIFWHITRVEDRNEYYNSKALRKKLSITA